MVIIKNDCILITKDDPSFSILRSDLTFFESGVRKIYKKKKNGGTYVINQNYNNTERVYQIYNNGISIPRGLWYYIKPYVSNSEIIDKQNKSEFFSININSSEMEYYSNILNGITLANEQLVAIRKMIMCKRCIIQSATGSGKTEIMCGFLKVFEDKFGKYPTTLIVEPTVSILNGTISRLKKYDIPISNYREERSIIKNSINICHPKSLVNDLKSNPELLKDVNVILGDEVHHMKSILFRTPSDNANYIDYSIGLSASAIQVNHVGKPKLTDYSSDELNIIGSTGPLVMNVTSGQLIESGRLATPVILAMNNPADEYIPEIEISNWHRIVSDKLYSDYRTNLTCRTAQFFSKNNRKVLILVNTIEWSRLLMKYIYDIDPLLELHEIRASYGGGKFEYFNGEEFISDYSNVLDEFSNGKYSILIGTSHIYEGLDVSNLDVIILAFGGRKERMVFQGIGRVLRKTKNGKYAYVIDFTDEKDPVLNSQFKARTKMYKNVMKVPNNMFFNNVEIDELESIFNKLENE